MKLTITLIYENLIIDNSYVKYKRQNVLQIHFHKGYCYKELIYIKKNSYALKKIRLYIFTIHRKYTLFMPLDKTFMHKFINTSLEFIK